MTKNKAVGRCSAGVAGVASVAWAVLLLWTVMEAQHLGHRVSPCARDHALLAQRLLPLAELHDVVVACWPMLLVALGALCFRIGRWGVPIAVALFLAMLTAAWVRVHVDCFFLGVWLW